MVLLCVPYDRENHKSDKQDLFSNITSQDRSCLQSQNVLHIEWLKGLIMKGTDSLIN